VILRFSTEYKRDPKEPGNPECGERTSVLEERTMV